MVGNIEFVVIDTSVVLAKLMPDEILSERLTEDFDMFLSGKLNFVAPDLIDYEVVNAVKSACLSKRFDEAVSVEMIEKFLRWEISHISVRGDFERVLLMSIKYKLSVYDACYLALAVKHECRLLTLDKKLKRAWEKETGGLNC